MEHLRSYEISVWTLQDSFITVLKPSNLEFKGQIVDPLMNIKDDGEDTLSLKIPMYIREDSGEMVENPLWYNTKDGTIIVDLRKLKVIFNKATSSEEVFEFLITNVKEEHEGLKKYCEVECEGLAFHELGKQGYKITLEGSDEIDIKQKSYFDEESDDSEGPQPTINYWADRVFKNSNWHYSVQMDWSMHDGITHQVYDTLNLDSDNYSSFSAEQRDAFNDWRATNGLRRRDRIYEDSFVSAWKYDENTDKLTPETITDEREKYRLVEASESNRYNLSQTIAETFQVYCKYKYSYDDNYHIINREVIFYNNFLNESRGVIDLTYKYNTEHLTRVMDATDTVSKMYVRPLKDGDTPTGEALIGDAEANKSKEDYLLNFDYLYNIGTITQEQYDQIEPYYTKLHKINEELIDIGKKLSIKEKEKIKQEARAKTAEEAMALDNENMDNNDAIARSVTDDEGNVPVTADNAQMLYLIPEGGDKKTYYCNFKSQGIVRDTIHLYWKRSQDTTTKKYYMDDEDEIKQYNIENDEFGEVSKVININKDGHDEQSWIYATFSYSPNTYFKKVSEIYGIRFGQDQAIFNDASEQVAALETEITDLTDRQNTILEEKAKIISDFENTMGPALREGTWQPEDEYSNYGEVYEKEIELKNNGESVDGLLSLGWDSELFDDEQDFHYQYGATLQDRYYPCIEITSALLNALTSGNYDITKFLAQLTLIYKNSETGTAQRIKQYIAINSKMKIAFLRNKISKAVTPVLMITDAATMDSEQLALLQSTGYLAYISSNTTTGVISETITYTNINWLIKPTEITNNKNYEIVYPRFKINSLYVKSPYTMVTVKRQEGTNWEVLANYENFYILPRTSYYIVTIKPEAIFLSTNPLNFPLKYKIYFTISMSPLAIYLDAVQVLKENSFPKVSYEIDVMSVNKEFVYDDYLRLGQIAHINDYEFKFENTMGYISELNLDLDRPWQDKIVIKNYKTKFEDIFSTITVQTEQMKKNSATIAMAASAFNSDGTLSSSILGESLMNAILARAADNTVDSSVPSPATEFVKYDPLIRNELRQVYNEAGEVLAAVNKSVEDVIGLNLKNADILGSFQVDIAKNMTPTLFRLGTFKIDGKEVKYPTRTKINTITGELGENESFKVGDILEYGQKIEQNDTVNYTIDTFLATTNSNQVDYTGDVDEQNEQIPKGQSFRGWSQTYDGSLAQIKGASLDIDAKNGKISLLAENELKIASGGLLKLAGNDVKIIGNRTVEIGGPTIKIYSGYKNEEGNLSRGIYIYSSVYGADEETSAVDITGNGVVIGSAGKIDIKSDKGINIFSSGTDSVSAIRINRTEGIYLGSSKPIRLFSGVVSSDGTGASVEISKDRISFGVSNITEGTAVDLTKDYIIFGAGSVVNSDSKDNIGDTQAGIQITKDAIKMASSSDSKDNRSYFVLDNEKVEFGMSNSSSNGAFFKIAKEGKVQIGIGDSNFVEEVDGFKQIKKGSSDQYVTDARFEVYAPNFIVDSDGTLYANGANISGTIRATTGTIGGWSIDSDMLYSGGKTPGTNNLILSKKVSSSTSIGGSSGSLDWMITASTGFGVTTSGALYANNANIKGAIKATSLYIGASNNSNGTELSITNGKINLSSINKGNLAEMKIESGFITLSSSSGTGFSNNSNVKIGPSNISINSNGIIDINSTNFKVNSSATGTNSIFYVGNNNDKYIKYSSSNGLEVKGTITATGGSIGGWKIETNSIHTNNVDITNNQSGSVGLSSGTFTRTINGNGISDLKFAIGSNFGVTSDGTLYAYSGKISGNLISSGTISGTSININNGQFTVDWQGNLIAKEADIEGTIKASEGNFGNCFIDGNTLTVVYEQSFSGGEIEIDGETYTIEDDGTDFFFRTKIDNDGLKFSLRNENKANYSSTFASLTNCIKTPRGFSGQKATALLRANNQYSAIEISAENTSSDPTYISLSNTNLRISAQNLTLNGYKITGTATVSNVGGQNVTVLTVS